MTKHSMIRMSLLSALGSCLMAAAAFAGPEITFGPEQQGLLKLDYKAQFQMIARDDGSGYANDENTYGFTFRRNRIALMGAYGDVMSLYVQTEFQEPENIGPLGVAETNSGGNFSMLDASLRFNFSDAAKVYVGKFKYNFTRENLEACEDPLTLDRSLFIRAPYVGTRDNGIALWGNLYQDRFQYRVDMMEGREASTFAVSPKSDFRFSARAHVSLLEPETEYGYKGTYLGTKKVFTLGAAVQYEPNVVFADTQVPLYGSNNYTGWTVDGFLEYPLPGKGTPTLSAAYEKVDMEDAYQGFAPDAGVIGLTGEKNGIYVKAGYLLPTMPLQLFGRYEKWRFAMLDNVYDQTVEWFGGGANYLVRGQNLKLTLEFNGTTFEKPGTFSGVQGTDLTTRDFNTLIAQLQVVF
jgi:hypothetical protein